MKEEIDGLRQKPPQILQLEVQAQDLFIVERRRKGGGGGRCGEKATFALSFGGKEEDAGDAGEEDES